LASHQIALNTASVTYMVPLGIGSAAAVRVGQALGRRDPAGARHAGWTGIALGGSFMFCMAILFWVAPRFIVRIFTPDPGIIVAASNLLFIAAFFQLFDGIQATVTGSHQIALNTASVTYMVPLGIGSAAAVRVGQALGRRDPAGARHAGWTGIALGGSFMFCMAILFWVAPRFIVRIFTPDPGIIVAASNLLFIAAFFQLFDGIQATVTGAMRGAGDTRTPFLCHLIAYWLIGLPLGYHLCFAVGWGAAGLWIGLSLALILIGVALLLFWRRKVESFSGMIA